MVGKCRERSVFTDAFKGTLIAQTDDLLRALTVERVSEHRAKPMSSFPRVPHGFLAAHQARSILPIIALVMTRLASMAGVGSTYRVELLH